jgi:predicted flap endonuclease-1-like 5' DNA nuclease
VEVVKEIHAHALTHAAVESVREVEKLIEVPVEVIRNVPVEVVKEIHAHALTHSAVESVREVEKVVMVDRPVEVVKEINATAIWASPVETVREVEKRVEVPFEVVRNVPVEVVKEIHATALTHEAVESVREVERVVTVDNTATANANGKRSYNMSITADEAHASDYGHTYLHSGDYKTFNYHYWKGEDGWYYLYFLNQAGHVVLMSDGYPTEDECRHNLAHILIHADEIDYYTRHTLRNGYYFYYLRDAEDNILAHSPRYKSATAMEQGILAFLGGKPRRDDLKIVEGIGPKIEELLNAEGIYTWRQLSRTNVEVIKRILTEAGPRFKMHNPTTWARQSEYAADGRFAELKVWQDELNGGKE